MRSVIPMESQSSGQFTPQSPTAPHSSIGHMQAGFFLIGQTKTVGVSWTCSALASVLTTSVLAVSLPARDNNTHRGGDGYYLGKHAVLQCIWTSDDI